MPKLKSRVLLFCAALVVCTATVEPCQAGPLMDWIRARRAYRRARQSPAYVLTSPVTVTAGDAPYAASNPAYVTSRYAPYAQLAPQPRLVNFAPRTVYRTSWVRVPVTTYRPAVSVDAMTGYPVTTYNPCTTFVWQARRIPYTTFYPAYPAVVANPCATPVVSSPVPCSPCAPAISQPTVSQPAAPYYAPPAGGAVMPASPVPPSSPTPATSPTPADVKPSLEPGQLQGKTDAAPGPARSVVTPESRARPAQGTPVMSQPLRPVPDPDATAPQVDKERVPQLLNPRDRTAQLTTEPSWAFASITWPEGRVAAGPRRDVSSQNIPLAPIERHSTRSAAPREWDDSGWRSLRK